jgi:hypothetical protein
LARGSACVPGVTAGLTRPETIGRDGRGRKIMARLFSSALARLFNAADGCCFCLGLALLVLSVLLVPSSRAVADTGDWVPGPLTSACLAGNACDPGGQLGCQNAGGRTGPCPGNYSAACQWSKQGCNGCPCKICLIFPSKGGCGCQCQPSSMWCTDSGVCPYYNGTNPPP